MRDNFTSQCGGKTSRRSVWLLSWLQPEWPRRPCQWRRRRNGRRLRMPPMSEFSVFQWSSSWKFRVRLIVSINGGFIEHTQYCFIEHTQYGFIAWHCIYFIEYVWCVSRCENQSCILRFYYSQCVSRCENESCILLFRIYPVRFGV